MTTELSNLEITPQELQERLTRGDGFILVDVREPWENATCSIAAHPHAHHPGKSAGA